MLKCVSKENKVDLVLAEATVKRFRVRLRYAPALISSFLVRLPMSEV